MVRVACFLLILSLFGCHKDRVEKVDPVLPLTVPATQSACFESRPVVRRVTNLTGRVWFSPQTGLYVINYTLPGTYDSVWVGFVCNLPEDYKVEGKEVVFSGEYRDGSGIDAPLFSGHEPYYLFLTKIN